MGGYGSYTDREIQFNLASYLASTLWAEGPIPVFLLLSSKAMVYEPVAFGLSQSNQKGAMQDVIAQIRAHGIILSQLNDQVKIWLYHLKPVAM